VVALCERPRDPPPRFIVADTPGQIEIFTWSASGAIITEALASAFPTMVAFVVDTPRCAHPQTFMSNMLQVRRRALGKGSTDRVQGQGPTAIGTGQVPPLLAGHNSREVCDHRFRARGRALGLSAARAAPRCRH